jgi:hypothetical protein
MNRQVIRERDVEAFLVKRVRALGGEVRKAKWIGRNAAPDRRLMLHDRPPMWVELKAPGKKPTAQQLREHERMRSFGELVFIIDSVQAVEDLLK